MLTSALVHVAAAVVQLVKTFTPRRIMRSKQLRHQAGAAVITGHAPSICPRYRSPAARAVGRARERGGGRGLEGMVDTPARGGAKVAGVGGSRRDARAAASAGLVPVASDCGAAAAAAAAAPSHTMGNATKLASMFTMPAGAPPVLPPPSPPPSPAQAISLAILTLRASVA